MQEVSITKAAWKGKVVIIYKMSKLMLTHFHCCTHKHQLFLPPAPQVVQLAVTPWPVHTSYQDLRWCFAVVHCPVGLTEKGDCGDCACEMQQPYPPIVRAQDLLLMSPLFWCLNTSLCTLSFFVHINIFVTSPYVSLWVWIIPILECTTLI